MVKLVFKILGYVSFAFAGIYFAEEIIPQFDGRKNAPPVNSIYMVKDLIDKSIAHKAKEYFPEEVSEALFKLERAERNIRIEMANNWFLRDFRYASESLSDASDYALALLIKSSKQENSDKLETEKYLEELKDAIHRTKLLFEHTSNNPIIRRRFIQGQISYNNAIKLYEMKRYSSALREAKNALFDMKGAISKSREVLSRYQDPELLAKWVGWRRRAIEESKKGGSAIVVVKESHILELYRQGKLLRTLSAELGANSINQKMFAGDRATPEGYYHITQKKNNSKYHLALLINYPNEEDKERFLTLKSNKELGERSKIGGLIEIHGGGGEGFDWTDGCVALTNKEMEYLYKMVSVGTPVAIIGSTGEGPINSVLRESR